MSKYFKWAELPPRTDVDTWEGSTRWGNHDLYPIPEKERNYGSKGFFSYYGANFISIYGFTSASAYVAAGLTVGETVGGILFGACIAATSTYFGARVGSDTKLGYTMMTRVTFGLWGSCLPLFFVLLANIVFGGITAYYGGQAVSIILGAIIPQFHTLPNTLPASAGITTQNLIGFLIYFIFYLPIVYYVPMHRLRKFLYPSCIITTITFFGMMGWVIGQNGGKVALIGSNVELTSMNRAFLILQCASSSGASYGASGDRFADWTRFSKSKHASTIPIMTGAPVMLTLTAVIGALTTSAFFACYGTVTWTPLAMLLYAQQVSYTPACRAGTFFAGAGLLMSLVYVNIVQCTVAFGMDFAGLLPRYVSMKRGAIILAVLSIAINPWRFLTQASIFITVISTFSIFSSCTSPMLNVDYWIVRKKAWKIPDLYHADGIYWYYNGWNLRAVAAWLIGVAPSTVGAVHAIMGTSYTHGVDYRLYQLTFFIGCPLSIGTYYIICKIWPPPGLGISEELPYGTGHATIDGTASNGDLTDTEAKDGAVVEINGTEKEGGGV